MGTVSLKRGSIKFSGTVVSLVHSVGNALVERFVPIALNKHIFVQHHESSNIITGKYSFETSTT